MNKIIGIIAQKKRDTLVSRLISFFTFSDYIHVEFIYEDFKHTLGSRQLYYNKQLKSYIDGVRVWDLEDGYFGDDYEIFLFNGLFDLSTKDLLLLTETAEGRLKNEYDYRGVLSFIFKKLIPSQDRDYCSSFILRVFRDCNIRFLNYEILKVDHITPKGILLSPFLSRKEKK